MEGTESATNIASATHVESMDMDNDSHAGTVNAKLQPWQDVNTRQPGMTGTGKSATVEVKSGKGVNFYRKMWRLTCAVYGGFAPLMWGIGAMVA